MPGGWCTPLLALFFVLLFVVDHANAQDAKESTKLIFQVQAASKVNPTESGRSSPIRVRVYELQDATAFSEADYFSLDTIEKATLGADLLAKDDFILRPGESRVIERKSNTKTAFIGVLAGYQDLANAGWRVTYKLKPPPSEAWYRFAIPLNKTTLSILLEAQGIVLSDKP